MKKIYVPQRELLRLVLLWATLMSHMTWAQTIPDSQWAHVGRTLAITTDGNIVTTERISQPLQFGGLSIDGDQLVKYSLQGDQLFHRGFIQVGDFIGGQIQGYNYEVLGGLRIAATTNGGLVFLGASSLIGKVYIGNVSATGNVGVRPYVDYVAPGPAQPVGVPEKMIGTPDGGYLILAFDYTSKSAYVNKYNVNSQLEWQKQVKYVALGSANPDPGLTKGQAVINTPDGGYLVAGYYNGSGNDTPEVGWVAKLDGGGSVVWQKLLGNLQSSPGGESIIEMQSITDVIVSADGAGYALVGTGTATHRLRTALLELNSDGGFRRASSIDVTATRAYITLYRGSGGQQFYAVGNSSLQNGVDPQILLVDAATRPQTDTDQRRVVARRTFEAPGDGPLNSIGVAGDGSLVFSTDNNQLVKLLVEPPVTVALQLTQPSYNCQTGAITFNTTGGNGSPITYNAPGISRSSFTSNTGTVEQGLRNDPKPITITATQNGQTVSYIFDFAAYCRNTPSALPPVLTGLIPNRTIAVGQSVTLAISPYFADPTPHYPGYISGLRADVGGLPEGLSVFSRGEPDNTQTVAIVGAPRTTGVYTIGVTAGTNAYHNYIHTTFTITVTDDGQSPQPPGPSNGGTLALTQPTYNCQTGAITFNTTGGDGSSITYNAPGISRSSLTSNTGTVEPGLRNDPKPITITATQNGVSASYTFNFGAYCANPTSIVRVSPISDLTAAVGQSIYSSVLGDAFFSSVTTSWSVDARGLPPGITYFFRQESNGSPEPTWVLMGTFTTAGVYSVTASASANGGSASTTFKIIVTNGNSPLTLTAPTYNCSTGAFTFNTSGGDGTPIEFMAVGITGWTTNPNQFVDKESRTANDVQPFTLMARQNGVTVTYVWDLKMACGRARVGVGEELASKLTLSVLGNPVSDVATVEIGGAAGKPLVLRLVDMSGKLLEQRVVEQPQEIERHRFEMSRPGLLLLRASSGTQSQTVKILKQ